VRSRDWPAWLRIALAIAVSWFAIDAQEPPRARPADSPATDFSAARALAHVKAIARVPHPMGSAESERVRAVLVKKLTALGLVPQIQVPHDPDFPLRNVLARLEGRGARGKKALMLSAHYDSVPHSPGAADDASGVAEILEIVRALRAGPPFERDLIVLFSDGEEIGLRGARLFVDEHPWARDVGVVLNLDTRGNAGPSYMFETSEGNGWLIRQFAQAVPRPLAASLSMDIYRIMPNDTDLTTYKQAGLAGLNFALTGGVASYHSPEDTPENLDLRSVQHQGENALALARQLGRLDLDDTRRGDLVYTSILNRTVLYYPRSWALPLAFATAALFAVVTGVGLRTGRLRMADLAAGIGVWLVAAVASIFAVGGFWVVLRDIVNGLGVRWLYFECPILTACAAVAVAVSLSLERRSAQRRPLAALGLGALFWWLAGAVATALWLPGGSYLFVWPVSFSLLGLGASFLSRDGSLLAWAVPLLGAIPALLLMPPLIRAAFDGLGLRLAAPVMLPVVLFLGAVLPLLGPVIAAGRRS
jgi:Peptidase family M28